MSVGRQIVSEFYDCRSDFLNDAWSLENILKQAATVAGATVIKSFVHQFSPHGVSGVVIIAESHVAIHTWPEYGYAAIDVFTCGDTMNPIDCVEYLQKYLQPCRVENQILNRGEKLGSVNHKPGLGIPEGQGKYLKDIFTEVDEDVGEDLEGFWMQP